MATFGDYYDLYNTEVGTWSGYNVNEKLNEENYQPKPTAHHGYWLEFVTNTHHDPDSGGRMTGGKEETVLGFVLKILYYYKASQSFSENEKDTWNSIDAVKKALYTFSGGRGDVMYFGTIEKENYASDFKLVTIPGTIMFIWSMS